jgi:tRNA(Ile)-lysidine synthase TilS/MesJ
MELSSRQGSLTILRPLLDIEKSEIQKYAVKRKLKYREDRSNKQDRYLRNKVRLKVIPYLEKTLGRELKGRLLGFRSRVTGVQDYVDQKVKKTFDARWSGGKRKLEVSVRCFRKLHPAIQYGTLSMAFQKVAGKTLEQKEWNRAEEVIAGRKKAINLRGNVFFTLHSSRFTLHANT